MERNVRYITIGAIFLAVVVAMVAFIMWIGRIDLDGSKYKEYVIYSDQEISGISTNTPIKYKGINIGMVKNIDFKDMSSGTIVVLLDIDAKLDILEGAYLSVDSSGLAGANFLSLKQGSGEKIKDNILPYQKGGISELLDKAQGIGDNLESLINKENTQNLAIMIEQIKNSTNNLAKLSLLTEQMLQTLNQKLQSGEYDVKSILEPSLYEMRGTLENTQEFLSKANNFLDRMEQNPYNTLFGTSK